MDKFISILIILFLLVGAVLMTFFVAVQVKVFIFMRTVYLSFTLRESDFFFDV